MKSNLYTIIFFTIFLLYSCSKDSPSPQNGVEDISLKGNVVFNNSTKLKFSSVNMLENAKSYGSISFDCRPVWSKDGSKFAAVELSSDSSPSNYLIKIINVEKETIKQWIIGDSVGTRLNGSLTWSPSGDVIAFILENSNAILYLDTSNGNLTSTELLLGDNERISAIAWNFNNNEIAINLENPFNGYPKRNRLGIIEPYSIDFKESIPTVAEASEIEYIDWDSQGLNLVMSFQSFSEIYTLNIITKQIKEIPNVIGLAPCWSPDGKYILYTGVSGFSGLDIIPGLNLTDMKGSFEKTLLSNARSCDWH